MKKRNAGIPTSVGGCSLLVIFGVLCLTVLALLSLSTALAEKREAEASARAVHAWYDADLQAQQIYASIRNGEVVPGVAVEGQTYRFCVPISLHQFLAAEVEKRSDGWVVLSWKAVASPEEIDGTLRIWQGSQ